MTDETEAETVDYGMPEHDPDAILYNKLSEMESQENATFRIYRQHSGNNAKMAFCFTVPADQYEWEELLSKIKEEYGGGDYRIHLRGPTQHGRNQLIANTVVTVENPKTSEQPQRAQNDLAPVMDRVLDRMDKMEERLQNPAQPVQQKDPMEMMTQMMGAMAQFQQMIPQPQTQPQGQQKSLVEQLEEAKKVHEMFGEMGGKEDGGFGQLMRDGLQPLIQLAQSEAAKKKEGGGQPQPKPNPQTRDPQNPEPKPMPQNNLSEQIGPLANHVRMLVAAAAKETDPEPYAIMVLDFTPEEQYAPLYEFLNTDGCIDAIIQYVPEVEPHKAWFESLRQAVLTELDPEDETGDSPDHVAGNDDSGQSGDIDGTSAGEGGDPQDTAHHVEDGAGGEIPATGT